MSEFPPLEVCLHSCFPQYQMAFYLDEISSSISSDTRAELLEQINLIRSDLYSFEQDPWIISTVKLLCSSVGVFSQKNCASRASVLRTLSSRIKNWSDLCTVILPLECIQF